MFLKSPPDLFVSDIIYKWQSLRFTPKSMGVRKIIIINIFLHSGRRPAKCIFWSQMFTISGMHVIHIHKLKKLSSYQAILFVGISGGTHISTIDHDELNIFLSHPFITSVTRLHRVTTTEHVTDVNNRVRPLETTSYPALTLQKFIS